MRVELDDPHVGRLCERIAALIVDGAGDGEAIEAELQELACRNSPVVAAYWATAGVGFGVPDGAFKSGATNLFPDAVPARTFTTSGTSGGARGRASYSEQGLALMDLSILQSARVNLLGDLERPVILRLVPAADAAPQMVMAYGMELIATQFGDPRLSACVVTAGGVDFQALEDRLDAACAEERPVILIGGSFAFVNVCDALRERSRSWSLPPQSRVLDAGGFKGRSRTVSVDVLRGALQATFGVDPVRCTNLFGMTELASQLYDAADHPVGPLGERPKRGAAYVRPRIRDAHSLELLSAGPGLLEVSDLCIIDRPCCVLTGDRGIATPEGVAVAGRVQVGQSRGCSLTLDALTTMEAVHA